MEDENRTEPVLSRADRGNDVPPTLLVGLFLGQPLGPSPSEVRRVPMGSLVAWLSRFPEAADSNWLIESRDWTVCVRRRLQRLGRQAPK